jgi:predicted DNA-binding transcriptional regulator AlpA
MSSRDGLSLPSMTDHLVGVAEVARMLRVSRQRAVQIVSAYADFPPPEVELASGRVWKRVAVEGWIRKHPVRRPGRRPAQT